MIVSHAGFEARPTIGQQNWFQEPVPRIWKNEPAVQPIIAVNRGSRGRQKVFPGQLSSWGLSTHWLCGQASCWSDNWPDVQSTAQWQGRQEPNDLHYRLTGEESAIFHLAQLSDCRVWKSTKELEGFLAWVCKLWRRSESSWQETWGHGGG